MYKKALIWVWAIYSAAGLVAILVAAFLPHKLVLTYTPTCYSVKQFGRECFMCGSTRSFLQAACGNFTAAAQYNRLALVLFFAAVINSILFIYFITNNLKHLKK